MLLIQDTVAVESKEIIASSSVTGPSIIVEDHDVSNIEPLTRAKTLGEIHNSPEVSQNLIETSEDSPCQSAKEEELKPRVGSVGDSKGILYTANSTCC